LKHLSPKEAEVFKLHLDGFSNDEIKEKLGVSYATVKNQLYDAKKKLRKIWEITGGLIVLWILKMSELRFKDITDCLAEGYDPISGKNYLQN
jgi:hypothetical protein